MKFKETKKLGNKIYQKSYTYGCELTETFTNVRVLSWFAESWSFPWKPDCDAISSRAFGESVSKIYL
jgi:hypothetical protein